MIKRDFSEREWPDKIPNKVLSVLNNWEKRINKVLKTGHGSIEIRYMYVADLHDYLEFILLIRNKQFEKASYLMKNSLCCLEIIPLTIFNFICNDSEFII